LEEWLAEPFTDSDNIPHPSFTSKKPSACVSVSSSLCSVSEELEFHLHFNPISTESTPNEFRGIIISRGKLNLVVTISMDGTF